LCNNAIIFLIILNFEKRLHRIKLLLRGWINYFKSGFIQVKITSWLMSKSFIKSKQDQGKQLGFSAAKKASSGGILKNPRGVR